MGLALLCLAVAVGWIVGLWAMSRRAQRRKAQNPPTITRTMTFTIGKPTTSRPEPPPREPDPEPDFVSAAVARLPTTQRIPLGRGDGFKFNIVGESQHQAALRALDVDDKLSMEDPVQFTALIVPEPENPYDAGAIRVCIDGGGPVGYFPRDEAQRYAGVASALAEMGVVGVCVGRLTGGWDEETSIGVKLSLAEPWTLLRRIKKGKPAPPV